MNWTDILALRVWTPLAEISVDAKKIDDGLYKIGEDAYIKTQPYNRNFEKADALSPFVTKAYWSASLNGIKRAIVGNASSNVEKIAGEVPVELTNGTSGFYSQLVAKIPPGDRSFSERAIYSNKGEFLYKLVSLGRLNYFFYNYDDVDEMVFLIEISLLK